MLLALVPFYINDLFYIRAEGYGEWILADYASKSLALLIVLAPASTRELIFTPQFRRHHWLLAVGFSIVSAYVVVLMISFAETPINDMFPDTILFAFPTIESETIYWIDITFGLALTAVSEEVLYRKLMWHTLRPCIGRAWLVVVLSCVLFGLAHWSNGLGTVLTTAVAGLVLIALYLKTGRFWAIALAHYVVNVVTFA